MTIEIINPTQNLSISNEQVQALAIPRHYRHWFSQYFGTEVLVEQLCQVGLPPAVADLRVTLCYALLPLSRHPLIQHGRKEIVRLTALANAGLESHFEEYQPRPRPIPGYLERSQPATQAETRRWNQSALEYLTHLSHLWRDLSEPGLALFMVSLGILMEARACLAAAQGHDTDMARNQGYTEFDQLATALLGQVSLWSHHPPLSCTTLSEGAGEG
jgi:hypothetical protein